MTEKMNKWENEIDVWTEEKDGYHLVIYRNPELGFLCGYIGVTRKHPWFAENYNKGKLMEVNVHGGLTYSDKGKEAPFKKKYWYFGFDCGHSMDVIPNMAGKIFAISGSVYRDFEYVKEEVDSLLEQLQDVKARRKDYQHNFVREYRKLRKQKSIRNYMRQQYA